MRTDRIIIAGTIRGGKHQQDQIISTKGICKCLTCGSHMNAAWMTLILEEDDGDIRIKQEQGQEG